MPTPPGNLHPRTLQYRILDVWERALVITLSEGGAAGYLQIWLSKDHHPGRRSRAEAKISVGMWCARLSTHYLESALIPCTVQIRTSAINSTGRHLKNASLFFYFLSLDFDTVMLREGLEESASHGLQVTIPYLTYHPVRRESIHHFRTFFSPPFTPLFQYVSSDDISVLMR